MSDNFFMIIESNYSQFQQNFDIFNSSFRSNQVFLTAKNDEISQYIGIDIFHNFIEQNKLLNLIWTKFNTLLDDKKKMQLTLEEKVLEKNSILLQEQQSLIYDLQIENKNLKSSLEKVLRKIINKNTKLDIAENLYMNKNFSKISLNTNNLLSGNINFSNNHNPLSNSKSQKSLLGSINASKSKSKSKPKTGNKNYINSKESNNKNASKIDFNGINRPSQNNDLKRLNTLNNSIDESKVSNGENCIGSNNEKVNKIQVNLNKFIEKISTEGVINKANLITAIANNDNLNMSVNLHHNYVNNNELLNNSHFINKSHNIDIDRELNNLLNESHNNIYSENRDLVNYQVKNNITNSSKPKYYEKKHINNTNHKINNESNTHNGISNTNKNNVNAGSNTLRPSQSLANFNNVGIMRKEKKRDFSNTRGIKKETTDSNPANQTKNLIRNSVQRNISSSRNNSQNQKIDNFNPNNVISFKKNRENQTPSNRNKVSSITNNNSSSQNVNTYLLNTNCGKVHTSNSNTNSFNNEDLANSEKLKIYLVNKEKAKIENHSKNKFITKKNNELVNSNLKSEKNYKEEALCDKTNNINKREWNNDFSVNNTSKKTHTKTTINEKNNSCQTNNKNINNLKNLNNKEQELNDKLNKNYGLNSNNKSTNNLISNLNNNQLNSTAKKRMSEDENKSTLYNLASPNVINNNSSANLNMYFQDNSENSNNNVNERVNKSPSSRTMQRSFNNTSKSFCAIEEMSSNGTSDQNFNDDQISQNY